VEPLLPKIAGRFGGEPGVVIRYLATSVVNVVNHQLLLQLAVRWWDWSGGQANVFAALVAALPAYLLSRYWVWQVDGRPSFRTEVIPFWTISLLGLLASTVTAATADRLFERPIMISVGSLVGYFVVWVAKFLVLDRLFDRPGDDGSVPVDRKVAR
jgi:putative flippase GtrA